MFPSTLPAAEASRTNAEENPVLLRQARAKRKASNPQKRKYNSERYVKLLGRPEPVLEPYKAPTYVKPRRCASPAD
ncbi:MAG: hypothetical protein V2I51_17330, partial [Anderseniella sp.]|nr:hypothetical protein [Anderseniella sp.]